MTATLTYDPATHTLLVLDPTASAASYRLVRRRPGMPDQVLPTVTASSANGVGRTWVVPGDGCPVLVLQGGTYAGLTEAVFTVSGESDPVAYVADALHTEALADNYAKHAAAWPDGHPITDCRAVLVRRDAARSDLSKNNPAAAHRLLSTTVFPR